MKRLAVVALVLAATAACAKSDNTQGTDTAAPAAAVQAPAPTAMDTTAKMDSAAKADSARKADSASKAAATKSSTKSGSKTKTR
jgi:hypothetical protein